MKFIKCPPIDPTYQYKLFIISVDNKIVSKSIGIKRAMGKTKYLKYSNFRSTVTISTANNKIIKTF